ncbi:peptide deformylase [Legionella maioricensis]|uniref:Peptide deformylase n=1 Tax=Legionella maioricensis TaxID=2896528 RepID=A0A9X2D1Z9_9GAMM|nr:peptide deformylase [Legionella maioricensis]MCL9684738.1 peptide deformylase [Legionella maioricensis]MCL9687766.1 peptide deformylase [Legionella maioricensis]
MPSQSIVKMGNKQLATPSLPIENSEHSELSDPAFLELIQNMKDTMKKMEGVGIAAPQIGCNKRVIMFGFEKNTRYPNEKPVPYTVLINPTIKILSDEMIDGWEGCLSVPGIRGLVPRYNHIEYSGYDLKGTLITREAQGFHARIVQHECDHLDGILYPQRLKDMQSFGFEDELKAIIFPEQGK